MTQSIEVPNTLQKTELIDELIAIVGPRGIVTGAEMASYEQGARYGTGHAYAVVRPATSEEVSRVVKLCTERGIQLIPQGANTGLVGASTPDATGFQVVLSLSRLKARCEVDVGNRSVTVDAGVLLHELNDRLQAHQLWFPIDLGADPSVGGMVAANTGGTRLVRYGDVRHNLLGVEVVLFDPPGKIERFGRGLRKDNTGFDLKQLFVGTSGSGAIITQATLEVHPRPRQSATALLVPSTDAAVVELLCQVERELGDFLSAFEVMSCNAMSAAIAHLPKLRNPFAPEPVPDFAILIELESTMSATAHGLNLQALLDSFLEARFGHEISNAVLGHGSELWALRHAISEGARQLGRIIAFDISVSRADVLRFCRDARNIVAQCSEGLVVVDFGHLADGGVHFNVVWPHDAPTPYDANTVRILRDRIYELVDAQYGGSFSAEHGVGPHNLDYYRKYTSAAAKSLAGDIRKRIDPQGLCGIVNF